jgi:hypothetical protein
MDNPDVLKLFHRHSVWMIRISVLVKVNGIRHYSFIDLILPCSTMPMKKLQHIRDIPGHCFSRHPRELMKDAVYEKYRRGNTVISLLPILFACEINIKFNSTFFYGTLESVFL